jgi:hypothetical protein
MSQNHMKIIKKFSFNILLEFYNFFFQYIIDFGEPYIIYFF